MKVLWAHGLEGRPDGTKPTYLANELGWDVVSPEMNSQGWAIAEHVSIVIQAIEENPDLEVIMGSSYGGLAVANAAARMTNSSLRLVLLAPAFGLAENFRNTVGVEGIIEWEETDSYAYFHHGFGHEVNFSWDFMTSADEMSWPKIKHPTTIIHGVNDDIVPIDYSRQIAANNDMIELIEVEDGHRLSESLHYIPLAVERVLSH
ncbi:MAG: hypothetical protein CND29_03575 [Marine Group II euryarchaeote MED-G36]|nr:MAG: hypothetical protein CND29_03575 [Marine Group II euryarchaeote MED-G36]